MNGNTVRLRQGQIGAVVARLGQRGRKREAEIRLFPCRQKTMASCRGVCKHDQPRPVAAVDESDLPVQMKETVTLPEVQGLYVGEYLHLAVTSLNPAPRYLHLFNMGISGIVAKLYPHDKSSKDPVRPNERYYVTGGKLVAFREGPYREVGDSETDDVNTMGHANGYPERVIAVLTIQPSSLTADVFHPDWERFRKTYRGPSSDFWNDATWSWGYLEIPVTELPSVPL